MLPPISGLLAILGSAPDPDAPAEQALGAETPGPAGEGTLLVDISAAASRVVITDATVHARDVRLEGTLLFETAAAQLGKGVRLYPAGDGLIGLTREVSLMGVQAEVSAVGAVRVSRGRLVIEPRTVRVGGPAWLEGVASEVLRRLVTIRHTVQGLPEGLRLVHVRVTHGGLRAELEGSDVQIPR